MKISPLIVFLFGISLAACGGGGGGGDTGGGNPGGGNPGGGNPGGGNTGGGNTGGGNTGGGNTGGENTGGGNTGGGNTGGGNSGGGDTGGGNTGGGTNAIDLNRSLMTVSNPLIQPGEHATITVQLKNNASQNLVVGGDTVIFSSTGGQLGAVSDAGGGRYNVTLTPKQNENLAGILVTASVNGKNIQDAVSIGVKVPANTPPSLLARLGKMIYMDENLSEPVGQSCNSCHDVDAKTFHDIRAQNVTSEGAKKFFGGRNTPTAGYAALTPNRHQRLGSQFGGQFWDGRAESLEEQARQPFLDPLEMANPNKQSVLNKLKNRPYINMFKQVFGESVLDNADNTLVKMSEAIAAFERTALFSPFNAKFDAVKAGTENFSASEARGEKIFNNQGRCNTCHSTAASKGPQLFTNFKYENIGTPGNPKHPFLTNINNPAYDPTFIDFGMGSAPDNVEDGPHSGTLSGPGNGLLKVPTLRNIEKTAPYMHNGVFNTLEEVVEFYNGSLDFSALGVNSSAEVTENISDGGQYNNGLGLSSQDINDLVAFMKTLTDR